MRARWGMERVGGIPHPLWVIGYGFTGRDEGFGGEFGAFGRWGHGGVALRVDGRGV